ncbi:MAG: helix-turn-helix transcriptional regulator [Solobacterium sp.]|nr:helix-turn-helix transcriptional regulator [Solobacterium sp.]
MFGEKLKKIREAHNLSQDELGERLGVSGKTVSSWEINRTEPNMGNVQKIADMFSVTTDSLIRENVFNAPILTEKGKNLLAAYDSASPDTKKAVDRILKISDTAKLSIEDLKRQEIAAQAWQSEFGGGDDSAIQRGSEK